MADPKDRWDKLDILLRPLGGIIAAVSVAVIGYFGTQYLKSKEIIDANSRVFAQIVSQREDADSNLRMNMFQSIIEKFFVNPEDKGQQVLSLELLAYNFHEALDLGPLFKRVNRDLRADLEAARKAAQAGGSSKDVDSADDHLDRLERVAKEVTVKQATTLAENGFSAQGTVFLEELKSDPQGVVVIDKQQLGDRWFKVEVLRSFPVERELRVKLTVYTKVDRAGANEPESWTTSDSIFNLGFYDFPMIDNTRLTDGKRAAVILHEWYADVDSAEIQLSYFPGSRASLKDKQYYDELLRDLLNLNTMQMELR